MDKKDLSNPDSFPIWRIDAGRLLQKFEPVIKDSVVVAHKALSTVSREDCALVFHGQLHAT